MRTRFQDMPSNAAVERETLPYHLVSACARLPMISILPGADPLSDWARASRESDNFNYIYKVRVGTSSYTQIFAPVTKPTPTEQLLNTLSCSHLLTLNIKEAKRLLVCQQLQSKVDRTDWHICRLQGGDAV